MKRLTLLLGIAVVLLAAVAYFRGGLGAATLWNISQGGTWLLPLVVVSALLDSVNPCAFSVLLLTIAFLLSLGKSRGSIVATGAAYIAGVFTIYVLIGLGIVGTLHLFNTPHFMARVGAILLIVLGGINIANELWPNFPLKLRIPQAAHGTMARLMENASGATAFTLGVFVGLCEFPCTGGPYLMVLGLLHDSGTYWSGLGYLALYNLIFIAPLTLILGVAGDKAVLAKMQEWKRTNSKGMRLWGGAAMAILGLLILLL
jgi:cytochrome c biogenesis protein CcdA